MNAELWGRVEQILADALVLPVQDRTGFAESQCGGDSEALEAVLALLDAERRMDCGYLESPLIDFARESFGHYRALSEIGRGGMSVVYLGERTGAEFDRRAAIKILLAPGAIKQDETRILASLEHPNIARLFDAGTTSSGFRFLVMEYVDGTRIDHYCQALSHRQRLGLFLQICAGVQHANRAFVVHRDLKPANIFVTNDGVVKLLDFGIAKLIPPGTGSDHTAEMRAWTPDYASPEQICGEPITASTDVYSLGVLLCELIGGERPRTLSDLSLAEIVKRAGGDEIEQVPLKGELALIDLAETYRKTGRNDRACPLVREAGEIFSDLSKRSTPMEPGPAERLEGLRDACGR